MRPHPPQISLRMLLFFIIVVALNCGAYRALFLASGPRAAPVLPLTENTDLVIGSLPLLTAVLMGISLYVARQFHRSRSRHEPTSRPGPCGMTYFSVHLLALGLIVITHMPELIKPSLEALARVDESGWITAFKRYPIVPPVFLIKCVTLGALISGPPLFLAWVGSLLARHCASRLSPMRFRLMACLVSCGFASVALGIWFTPTAFAEVLNVDLRFQLVDEDSGKPIGAATVRVTDGFKSRPTDPSSISDANGLARLTAPSPPEASESRGERPAFSCPGVDGWRSLRPNTLTCESRSRPRWATMSTSRSPGGHKIELTSDIAAATRFQDIAGMYSSAGLGDGGLVLEIEPDGRFTWTYPSCAAARL